MLDPQLVRTQPEFVKACLEKRKFPVEPFDQYIVLDKQWRDQLKTLENLKHQQKQNTPNGKPTPDQLSQLKQFSEQIKGLSETVLDLESQVKEAALELPNVLADDVPQGHDESHNLEVRVVGTPRVFDFKPKSHDELGEKLDIMDFSRAAKIAGSRFVIHKGLGARLVRSIMNFMLNLHTTQHGYQEVWPPVMVNSRALNGTGQLPKFSSDQFKIADTDYWLSPTAEVQLTNFFQNEIIDEERLPIRMTAFTSCFRKEAGSYGKDEKGIIRNHQFDKVELVKFVHPDRSFEELESLVTDAETVLKLLELPYRVVKLCAGDIGICSAKTYDLEVWFPSQGRYREISSCSNFLDFQARRAMIRYRNKANQKVDYLHTLNGSGLAIGRTLAAILENNQNEDGTITVPSVLKKEIGVEKILWLKETISS